VADTVRKRMRAIYQGDQQHAFLDPVAANLLDQGRATFARLKLADTAVLAHGADTIVLPWRGDTVMNTLAVLLQARGLEVGHEGVLLTVGKTDPDRLREIFRELAVAPPLDAAQLAAGSR
jgi:ATP-dependent Lhr-like helicase